MANTSINCSSLAGTPRKRGVIANGGDRFIPTRSKTNFELEYFKVTLINYFKLEY